MEAEIESVGMEIMCISTQDPFLINQQNCSLMQNPISETFEELPPCNASHDALLNYYTPTRGSHTETLVNSNSDVQNMEFDSGLTVVNPEVILGSDSKLRDAHASKLKTHVEE